MPPVEVKLPSARVKRWRETEEKVDDDVDDEDESRSSGSAATVAEAIIVDGDDDPSEPSSASSSSSPSSSSPSKSKSPSPSLYNATQPLLRNVLKLSSPFASISSASDDSNRDLLPVTLSDSDLMVQSLSLHESPTCFPLLGMIAAEAAAREAAEDEEKEDEDEHGDENQHSVQDDDAENSEMGDANRKTTKQEHHDEMLMSLVAAATTSPSASSSASMILDGTEEEGQEEEDPHHLKSTRFYCWSHVHARCACAMQQKRLRYRLTAEEWSVLLDAVKREKPVCALEFHILCDCFYAMPVSNGQFDFFFPV